MCGCVCVCAHSCFRVHRLCAAGVAWLMPRDARKATPVQSLPRVLDDSRYVVPLAPSLRVEEKLQRFHGGEPNQCRKWMLVILGSLSPGSHHLGVQWPLSSVNHQPGPQERLSSGSHHLGSKSFYRLTVVMMCSEGACRVTVVVLGSKGFCRLAGVILGSEGVCRLEVIILGPKSFCRLEIIILASKCFCHIHRNRYYT